MRSIEWRNISAGCTIGSLLSKLSLFHDIIPCQWIKATKTASWISESRPQNSILNQWISVNQGHKMNQCESRPQNQCESVNQCESAVNQPWIKATKWIKATVTTSTWSLWISESVHAFFLWPLTSSATLTTAVWSVSVSEMFSVVKGKEESKTELRNDIMY